MYTYKIRQYFVILGRAGAGSGLKNSAPGSGSGFYEFQLRLQLRSQSPRNTGQESWLKIWI
jgi:hypothetical protein